MMKRATTIGAFLGAAILLLPTLNSCSKSDRNALEEAEGITAEMTADQMEAAKEGRSAARAIVTRNWGPGDSLKLQEAILNARAVSSKYELQGKDKCRETFDTAFFNTIRTVRPELADQLHPEVNIPEPEGDSDSTPNPKGS